MNRLAEQPSAYLRSAAHQPIHWFPWSAAAFEAARRDSKPILLDIGAVWCHWCHVMDGESYEDPGLADLLNRHFVCVKVDRDQRPDVDARYQRAVQAMTGQGGWPLTAFLTPDGEVFFGGTYFPPDDRHGRPGFRTVLEQVLRFWRERGEDALDRAGRVREALARISQPTGPGPVGGGTLLAGERRMLAHFDQAFGGFGSEPKFPHPTALRFLMGRWVDARAGETRHAALETLRAMARGGIHDHLGGGFHRYSVDRRWIVPHFEKMSYDNSELLRAFVLGAELLGDSACGAAARGIIRWVRDVLSRPDGGFGTSQDADVGLNDDGSYFTWTREELSAALSREDFELALRRFGIGTLGRMPEDPDRNVLFIAADRDELSREFEWPGNEMERRLEEIRKTLLRVRQGRPRPQVDPTPYASWNAMMAGALLRAAPVLDDDWARDAGLTGLERLRRVGPEPDRLAHQPGTELGFLEDQVHAADAAIDGYETTSEPSWLRWAEGLLERAWRDHRSEGGAGLTDRSAGAAGEGLLGQPVVPIEDAPVPSANGIAAVACARLAAHTGSGRWAERHRSLVEAFGESAPGLGLHGATWYLAADWLVRDPVQLIVTGNPEDPAVRDMHRAARAAPVPRRVVQLLPRDARTDQLPAELRGMLRADDRPRAYLCIGTRCLAPADSPAEWRERLAEVHGLGP